MKRLDEMLPLSGKKSLTDENASRSNGVNVEQNDECEICGGLGWTSADVPVGHPMFGKLVQCPHQRSESKRLKAHRIHSDLGPLRKMMFKNFQISGHAFTDEQRASLESAIKFARRFAAEQRVLIRSEAHETHESDIQLRHWLFIQGGYGCGKTHLAAAIANMCLNQGIPVMFVNVPDLLDYLRAAYSPSAEETFDQRFVEVRDAPVLILDDLGTQNTTPWAEEKLYQILNARYVAKSPTVITTNLDLDDLDPRLRSRLSDIDLVWRRVIKAPDFRRGGAEHDRRSMSSLSLYHDMTFASFDLRRADLSDEERTSLKQALELAKSYAEYPQGWLILTGNYGVGKTHLAAAIANEYAERGYPVLFVVVPDLLDHLRAAFSPDALTSFDQRFEEARSVGLLILDDLGTESATPWAREKLYQIINYRYVARRPTVITTSLSPKTFDQRIYTRISDEIVCKTVNILAPSYRRGPVIQPIQQDRLQSKKSGQKRK